MANRNNHKDISIVIINYKCWSHLRNCLNSLEFSSESFSFEVIVVDNQSQDGKLEDFQNQYDWVNFIENTGNNGFANGCNLGASHAQGTYLMFLNPDTITNELAIDTVWRYAQQNPNTGIVSCIQKRPNGKREKSYRRFPRIYTLFGLLRAIAKVFRREKPFRRGFVLYTSWVSGSLVFISREWFEQIQGWNEDYWMYYEDMDISKRIQMANGKVVVLENVEIIHNHGGSSRINFKTSSLTKTESQISKHVFVFNHFKGAERFLSLFILVLFNIVVKFFFAIFGVIFFFIPKMRLNVYLWTKIIKYYLNCIVNRTWLSSNSMNYKKA